MRTFSLDTNRRVGLLAALVLILLLGMQALPVAAEAPGGLANATFAKAYDAGGLGGVLWGSPRQTLNEQYSNSKDGQRQVQYFDKGRMELTYPDIQPNFAGDGKLVVEMVTGRMQIGDTLFWQFAGAESPIAGGPTFGSNPHAPSYRAFQSLRNANPSRVGRPVTAVVNEPEDEGFFLGIYSLGSDGALGSLATNAAYIPETAHNVPDVFWSYLNQKNADGLPAFNWQTLFGLPITDSYWAKVRDGDKVMDILVQLYERRTLLYNPAAAPGAQVTSGNVGVDYYRWRYEQPELKVIEDSLNPPNTSANAKVTPTIGESGTTFSLEASGFQPGEMVDNYARITQDGGVYDLAPFQADSNGKVRRFFRTRPLDFPTWELYFVLTGRVSRVNALWHFKVIGSVRYTPGVEAAQPGENDVPSGNRAAIDRKVLRVGEVSRLFAVGFQPNEYLKGWVTTPLNRVVGWVGLVNSFSTVKNYAYLLQADKDGIMKMELPAPGTPLPGIYSFTLYGLQSKNTATAYFRVRTGLVPIYDPVWGRSDFEVDPPNSKASTVNPLELVQNRSQYRPQIQALLATAVEG